MHWYSLYIMCAIALVGLFFERSRNICLLMIFSVVVMQSVEYSGIGGIRRGFIWAGIDLMFGYMFMYASNKNNFKAISLLLFIFSFTNLSMTIAVLEQNPTMVYNNYELIVAILNLLIAYILLGSFWRDVIRFFIRGADVFLNFLWNIQHHIRDIKNSQAREKWQ